MARRCEWLSVYIHSVHSLSPNDSRGRIQLSRAHCSGVGAYIHTYITTDSAPVRLSIWWSTSFVNKTQSYLNPLTCGNNWFPTWREEFTLVWQSITASEWGANSCVCGRSQSDRANRIIISEHQRCNPEITRLDTFHLLAVPTELMH